MVLTTAVKNFIKHILGKSPINNDKQYKEAESKH